MNRLHSCPLCSRPPVEWRNRIPAGKEARPAIQPRDSLHGYVATTVSTPEVAHNGPVDLAVSGLGQVPFEKLVVPFFHTQKKELACSMTCVKYTSVLRKYSGPLSRDW